MIILPGRTGYFVSLTTALVSAGLVGSLIFKTIIKKYIKEIAEIIDPVTATKLKKESLDEIVELVKKSKKYYKDRFNRMEENETIIRKTCQQMIEISHSGKENRKPFEKEIKSITGCYNTFLEKLKKIIVINKEMVVSSAKIAQATNEMTENATRTADTASEGIKNVGREIKAMSDLKMTIGNSAEVIAELQGLSKHISAFVTTVSAISKRTELLALNAGIEAARAGESGRGFAVVANEIRTLSETSKSAAHDVGEIIFDIQEKTSNVVKLLKNTNKVEENIKVVYSAGDTFMDIVMEINALKKSVNTASEIIDETKEDAELMNNLLLKLQSELDLDDRTFESVSGQWRLIDSNWEQIEEECRKIQSLMQLS